MPKEPLVEHPRQSKQRNWNESTASRLLKSSLKLNLSFAPKLGVPRSW